MFGYQWFIEVLHSLKAHKIRTIFSGFGVMWAMLIWVLLQGVGSGIHNGMMQRFRSYTTRCMYISEGYGSTASIHLTEAIANALATGLNLFSQVMPFFQKASSVAYGPVIHKSDLLGVGVGYEKINDLALVEGRFFNARDIAERRSVCILGLEMKKKIFDARQAVGQFIAIDGVRVCVIGVLDETIWFNNTRIMLPSSLFKALFRGHAEGIDGIIATLAPKQNAIEAAAKVLTYLAKRLNFNANQQDALCIRGPFQRTTIFEVLFNVMKGFIGLVSLCFLVSGVVGVSNMMLVVVKERRQELAIRKVMGAKPSDIMGLILLESIVINLISGILGLGAGIGILQWMNRYLLPMVENHGIARFEFQFSLYALVVLVLSGCLAAIIPIKRVGYIKPVDALNKE
ncbi:MacB-like periplasmic core domain/FtsX-like permease family protein [Cardinium endosymbiont of Sogatella furcifera]|uniref:ABC transporter permease n=1 Tax=Cardinium endosymbiont of Sogatella furcifera TaxID=650378 RepID=UPI000E0D6DCC|nr:ABC transporter permease [Cardinium endosymbiont of Sogatella furcifera]AXI24232.1 MacB-like periplasmic core domain/FtsX-like permease family protein [Cardinium endosymbiont of Sogatella furcifera]